MPNMRQDKRLTTSATRQARVKGNAGGSQPRPRPTSVSSMKPQGPLKPKATTSSAQRGGTTGTARVTSSNRPQSPRLPNLPKNPVKGGTTNTIRATGGNSNYPKINRLSTQAAKPSNVSSLSNLAQSRRNLQAAGAKAQRIAGKVGAVGVGTNLFMQGKSGSEIDKLARSIPGMKANPKTDLGKRAGDAIARTTQNLMKQASKALKKSKKGY